MLTPERQAKLDIIAALPEQLKALVKNLNQEQLNTPYLNDEWAVKQIVHHLADSHMNSLIRLKLILTEDNPPLKPYDEGAWAKLPDTQDVPIAASLQLLRGLHQRWVYLFANLPDNAWSRTGVHQEIGPITPDDLLTIYAEHCDAHLEQIRRTLAAAAEG